MANDATHRDPDAAAEAPTTEEALFRQLLPLIRAEARRTIPRDLVDDVVQDAVERLLRNGRAALRRWDRSRGMRYFRRILINIYIDQVRTLAKRPNADQDVDTISAVDASNLETRVLLGEIADLLRPHVDEIDRVILTERVVMGTPSSELAQSLGLSVSCVNTRRFRLVKLFRSHL